MLNTSIHGFHHPLNERSAFDDPPEERAGVLREDVGEPGFMKFTSNYVDILMNPDANAEWCEFIAGKIRGIVDDPDTAERLIPKDHRYGEKRPPYVAGYFEAFNRPHVSLVDLRDTPIVRVTETGIETTDGVRELDVIVWATGFDFGTGAMLRMGIRGRDGLALDRPLGRRPDHVPRRADRTASRTSSSPAARTPPPATTPATTATRSTSSPTRSCTPATTATTSSRSPRRPRSGGRR